MEAGDLMFIPGGCIDNELRIGRHRDPRSPRRRAARCRSTRRSTKTRDGLGARRVPDPADDEGVGARRARKSLRLVRQAGAASRIAEALVRIDATVICATDIEVIEHGTPVTVERRAPVQQGLHARPRVHGNDRRAGRPSTNSRSASASRSRFTPAAAAASAAARGSATSSPQLRPELRPVQQGHRANGFTTDGGFAQYAINHVNTLVRVPDYVSDEVATLIVTAGTAMYGSTCSAASSPG